MARNALTAAERDRLLAVLLTATVEESAKVCGVSLHTAYAWDSRLRRGICACGKPLHQGPCGVADQITPELKARIIAARDDEQLTTQEIASRFGISHQTAIGVVIGHPLQRRRKHFDPTHWTGAELDVLEELYPAAPWPHILEALKPRAAVAIARKASELGIRRAKKESVNLIRLSPEVLELRRRREGLGIPLRAIGDRLPEIPQDSLRSYEAGYSKPPADRLAKWKAALDAIEGGDCPAATPPVISGSKPETVSSKEANIPKNTTRTAIPPHSPQVTPQSVNAPPSKPIQQSPIRPKRPAPSGSIPTEDEIAAFIAKKGITKLDDSRVVAARDPPDQPQK